MSELNLITDRTQDDVSRLAELYQRGPLNWSDDEWDYWRTGRASHAAYNAEDLNRVSEAVEYIAALLNGAGYNVEVTPKTDWEMKDFPKEEQMREYLDQVKKVRETLDLPASTPDLPLDMSKLTWSEANDIEQILLDLLNHFRKMERTIDVAWANNMAHAGLYAGG